MTAAGVSFENTLKRSIAKKPKMVANFSRNAGWSGGFMKIGGGMQSGLGLRGQGSMDASCYSFNKVG